MSTEMTIVLTIAYFLFWVWGYSRKAQPSVAPNTPDGYINYFPDIEEEEELSLNNSSSSSIPVDVRHLATQVEVEFDHYASEGMAELMSVSVTATDVRHLATQAGEMVIPNEVAVAVLPDPWTEQELNVAVLEFCYQLPVANTVQLALPPAVEPVSVTLTDYVSMTIRELKAECKRLGIKKYSYLKKQQLIELLSSI